MTRLLRAEWRKVVTTRLWWGMLLGTLALTALGVVAQIASNGARGNPAPPLSDPTTQRAIFSSSAAGELFSMVVGIILITTEFRHFTSRPTFLTEPHRGRVIAAKLVVAAVVGFVYAVCDVALTAAIAVPWLGAKGISIDWSGAEIMPSLLGAVASVTIFGIIGVGVGVLIRNQVAAVITALAYRFIAEGLISLIPYIKEVHPYLPGAAAAALTGGRAGENTLTSQWEAGAILLGWGLLFAVAGYVITARRDIP